jgi:hypothetical protein
MKYGRKAVGKYSRRMYTETTALTTLALGFVQLSNENG